MLGSAAASTDTVAGSAGRSRSYTATVRLELHCHSTCSDGSLSPEELAHAAGSYGVELFCLTDHDTMAGCGRTAAALPGTRVLRGLELSCKAERRTVHLLMWGVAKGPGREALEGRLRELRSQRRQRIVAICARLAELGVPLSAAAILADVDASGRTPGRPDVARALVAAGVCSSPREAFDRFLKDGGRADVPIAGLSLSEGLALGRAAGARMALAHPHTVGHFAVVRELVARHRGEGLEDIEAFYGDASPVRAEPWLRLAAALDLVPTGGSDFHGPRPGESARVGVELPAGVGARLREWLADCPALAGDDGDDDYSSSATGRPASSTVVTGRPAAVT